MSSETESPAGAKPDFDVIVAGAGPAGLAAALQFDGLGLAVCIVAPETRQVDHRTAALLVGSVSFLDQLGVWANVVDEAGPLRSLRIVDATRRLIRAPEVLFHASEIGQSAFGYNVGNATLVDALSRHCADRGIARVIAAVTGAKADRNAASVTLDDGSTATARLVIAADGRQSKVRESVGIPVRTWAYEQSALVTNLTHSLPHDDTSTEFHTEEGPFTLVPLTGNRSSLVWVSSPAEAARRKETDPAALAREIEDRAASLLGEMRVDSPVQTFPLTGMAVSRFSANRIALIGEAAHVFPPIGAQGLNLGYRDVADLAAAVGSDNADVGADDVLRRYDRSRRLDAYTRTAAVDALNRTLLTGFLPVQALRGMGLFLLDRIPVVRRALMRQGIAPG
ncbi:UbiH/UbiF family hydroxylase [Bauldia sp.]|uniref:UbiH/UbiF family hydroxylase n=1 Tax=Bauldia sp. TaxID=2575872 RepID=UPI003BAA7288